MQPTEKQESSSFRAGSVNKWTRTDVLTIAIIAVVFIGGRWAHKEYLEWKVFFQAKANVIDKVGDSLITASGRATDFVDSIRAVLKADVDSRVRQMEDRQRQTDVLIETLKASCSLGL